ncbi:PH, RCC1 and FYVE domains-containing protein 1-like [Salvia miltiorrhiza]|uniref:PH, RCC1 and FYVE domains-containing protein 1-like n=1 Tax=Salvia miltiorrhiza TaxID=226208 RepID=UPI0025AD734F|nr:PH, RCC1 and FYVE domains-containing protein 1-like [Salvia miltiorrhiza]XP_057785510.1 PH, RCC1 and FYVE domains-containing protein 1-like [Salvia miltiorrhiza]XP_057785511.1 PH, RCC1 and FYVE domains-containing protein 1-like [Salvia miltiorrhiza]XP_057785512.1 PH, RCC1 and FYVE domains-containing protein 1-like [Salvia miltiorrhiza]XP_057785513.1 PH, RCC1 and FYVE domains-containing protein 1-like [Salvia miltiorrhiza]XP_057785514.1 PH, RCC1 and FYVE domains-containing protein 1-like [Sa
MQMRASNADGFRISISSTPSCSSQGSGTDDIESLGDIYVWGEIWYDEIIDGTVNPNPIKNDVLTPKVVESNVVLDVQQIACGVQHIALVTRQGEVFTWGEESGGRLGHGVEKDFSRPRLVEFLALTNIEFVACGEFHTSALSASGDLYTWGDGTHNVGLLGHGKNGSHWIPKRVSGSLESLHVTSVACGTWHSAVVTSTGNLFTFGDGTFGALGHGDHESVAYPKEVQSLRGLKTVSVSCGAWHTAAIVEVTSHPGVNASSRKLFTWGDGDKNRLGHGDKETYLVPTCVSAIIDYNIQQLACGHNITVALTTSGHVFTMGSTQHGQLGDPQSDGKRPRLVQDALVGQFVEQISCGTHHVAVLTGRNEVFTWGKGANGRLGHGDLEDRNVPTMVEALKDKHVKSIVCGSNYTASICIHKWVAGPDQSFCTACKQAFGFTRKRHNCYNCGLVHCHACLSKKSLRAALAPTPGKPHRVCDSCYLKLKKGADIGNGASLTRRASGTSQRIDRGVGKTSQVLLSNRVDPVKYLDIKSAMRGTSASQVPSRLQLRDVSFPSSFSVLQRALKPVITSAPYPQQASPQPQPYSRPVSPQSQANSAMSMAAIDSLQVANEILTQQVSKLHNQVKSLKQKNESQDTEIQKLKKATQETNSLAAAGSSKCVQAVQAVKTISHKLKEIREKIPLEISESESFKLVQAQVESLLHISGALASEGISLRPPEPTRELNTKEHLIVPQNIDEASIENNGSSVRVNQSRVEGGPGTPETASAKAQREVIEQFEPGVYVTLLQLPNGNKFFKRIRFSKRRFSENQAEEWWTENKERLLRKYNPTRTSNMPGDGTQPESPAEVFHEAAQSFADLNVVQD